MSLPLQSVAPIIGATARKGPFPDIPDLTATARGVTWYGTAGTCADFYLDDNGEISVDANFQDGETYVSRSVSATITEPDYPLRWYAEGANINTGDYTFQVLNRVNVQSVDTFDDGKALSVHTDVGRDPPITCSFTIRISRGGETITEFNVRFTSISTHYIIIL